MAPLTVRRFYSKFESTSINLMIHDCFALLNTDSKRGNAYSNPSTKVGANYKQVIFELMTKSANSTNSNLSGLRFFVCLICMAMKHSHLK